jgi:hypothetical protein
MKPITKATKYCNIILFRFSISSSLRLLPSPPSVVVLSFFLFESEEGDEEVEEEDRDCNCVEEGFKMENEEGVESEIDVWNRRLVRFKRLVRGVEEKEEGEEGEVKRSRRRRERDDVDDDAKLNASGEKEEEEEEIKDRGFLNPPRRIHVRRISFCQRWRKIVEK